MKGFSKMARVLGIGVLLALVSLPTASAQAIQRMRIPAGTYTVHGPRATIDAFCVDQDRPAPQRVHELKGIAGPIQVRRTRGDVSEVKPLDSVINDWLRFRGNGTDTSIDVEVTRPEAGVTYELIVDKKGPTLFSLNSEDAIQGLKGLSEKPRALQNIDQWDQRRQQLREQFRGESNLTRLIDQTNANAIREQLTGGENENSVSDWGKIIDMMKDLSPRQRLHVLTLIEGKALNEPQQQAIGEALKLSVRGQYDEQFIKLLVTQSEDARMFRSLGIVDQRLMDLYDRELVYSVTSRINKLKGEAFSEILGDSLKDLNLAEMLPGKVRQGDRLALDLCALRAGHHLTNEQVQFLNHLTGKSFGQSTGELDNALLIQYLGDKAHISSTRSSEDFYLEQFDEKRFTQAVKDHGRVFVEGPLPEVIANKLRDAKIAIVRDINMLEERALPKPRRLKLIFVAPEHADNKEKVKAEVGDLFGADQAESNLDSIIRATRKASSIQGAVIVNSKTKLMSTLSKLGPDEWGLIVCHNNGAGIQFDSQTTVPFVRVALKADIISCQTAGENLAVRFTDRLDFESVTQSIAQAELDRMGKSIIVDNYIDNILYRYSKAQTKQQVVVYGKQAGVVGLLGVLTQGAVYAALSAAGSAMSTSPANPLNPDDDDQRKKKRGEGLENDNPAPEVQRPSSSPDQASQERASRRENQEQVPR
jgi:hypothetical protein